MGSKGGSAPQSPDPVQTADQQIRVNQATIDQLANANRINQVNPLGSSNWTKDPTTGQWTQTQTIDPRIADQLQQQITNTDLRLGAGGNAMQQVLNSGQAGTQVNLGALPLGYSGDDLKMSPLVGSVDPSGLPQMPTGIGGGDAGSLKQAQDATYKQMASRLDPQYQQAQQDLQQQLTDQGVVQGSDAWNKAMSQFQRQKTDAYQTANNSAVQAGNALESQLFGEHATQAQYGQSANNQAFQQLLARAGFQNSAAGQNFQQQLQQGQFGNQARQQALAEQLQARMAPINEANALATGGQAMLPQFGSGQGDVTPQGAPNMGSLYGQQYQGQLNAYNANVGSQNATLGTLGSLAAAAMFAFCSRDYKRSLGEFTGAVEAVKAMPVDRWQYKGDQVVHIGPYAEDFHKATGTGDDKSIHFIDAIGVLIGAVRELVARVESLEAARG